MTSVDYSEIPLHEIRLNSLQRRIIDSQAKYKVWISGRKSGKSFTAAKLMLKYAAKPNSRVRFFSKTRKQAKDIIWADLKKIVTSMRWHAKKPNESNLSILLRNGSEISVDGLEKADNQRGPGFDFVVLDEFAFIPREAWDFVVSPTLAQRDGDALFISTPTGKNNWGYDFYLLGQSDDEDWDSWLTTTAEVGLVSEKFLANAKKTLDLLSYQQEYEANFVNFTGRCYYPFDQELHCHQLSYEPDKDVSFCFDFNVSPGVCVILQEGLLPNGNLGTKIIDEIWIPKHSNTKRICDELIKRYRRHRGLVRCYGDATGGAEGSAKIQGSDWSLIEEFLTPVFGNRLLFLVPSRNPKVRERINASNSRLCSASGAIQVAIDPKRCPHTVKDFDSVSVNSAGDIEKQKDPNLTHTSDAVTYYFAYEFPLNRQKVKTRHRIFK